MQTSDEYYNLENLLFVLNQVLVLKIRARRQSEPPFDINTVWPEYGPWLWGQLGESEQAQAQEFASYYAHLLYKGRRSVSLIWSVIAPNVAPPRSRDECRRYAWFTTGGIAYVCRHFLGTTLGEMSQRIGLSLLAKRDRIGQQLERMEKASQPLDLRLQKLIRQDAGALVDIYFGRYKRYRALSGAEREALLDELEEAGGKGLLKALYDLWLPPIAASLLPIFKDKMFSVFDPVHPSMDSLAAFASVLFPLLLDMWDGMTADFAKPHSELREAAEESIHQHISDTCQQLVEMKEKYNECYRSRRQDRHLTVIRCDARRALAFDIMLEAKDNKTKMKELADREEVPVRCIYDLRRVFKYHSQRQLEQRLP